MKKIVFSFIWIGFFISFLPLLSLKYQDISFNQNLLYAQDKNISFIGEWFSGHCLAVKAKGDFVYFNQGSIYKYLFPSYLKNILIFLFFIFLQIILAI